MATQKHPALFEGPQVHLLWRFCKRYLGLRIGPSPLLEAFERFVQGWLEVSSIRGLDSAIGDKLCRLVFDAGGVLQHYAVFQPQLKTPEEKLLISMCMDESKQVHIDTNAMTEQLAQDLIAELKTLASDNNVIGFVRNVQVAAIKPA